MEQFAPHDWDAMVATNLTGTFLCTRAAVPHLRERGGVIINMSSSMASRIAAGDTNRAPDRVRRFGARSGVIAHTDRISMFDV
ncbi:SDR family NAD(P)-dependent oxidoreductase [Nocardia sp. NPDC004860]|uniref:SDR family NAD(P)-dependent oxidoreductase n=1 Tax=Nocardia sp. NPDC004860 TaxID=3154557 RepID=UPI0033A555C7